QLSLIEYGPWGADSAAGPTDAVAEVARRRADEHRGSVDGEYFVDVVAVEQVEGVHRQVQAVALAQMQRTREAQVDGLQAVAAICIAGGITHAVGYRVAVIVGVKTDEQCERTPRLQRHDAAQLGVAQRPAPLVRSVGNKIRNKPVAGV